MSEQQEEAEHDDNDGIAPAGHFHWLQCHEQGQHGYARIAAKERAVFEIDACGACGNDQRQQPARWQSPVFLPEPGAERERQAGNRA